MNKCLRDGDFQLTRSMSRLSTQILLLTQGLNDSLQRLAQQCCREVILSSRSVLACVESTSNEEGGEGVFIPHLQKTSRYALFRAHWNFRHMVGTSGGMTEYTVKPAVSSLTGSSGGHHRIFQWAPEAARRSNRIFRWNDRMH